MVASLVPAPAGAASGLWATVNRCDPPAKPHSMGVRASMPGDRRARRMYMRFRVQYWSPGHGGWRPVTGAGVSPWVYAGPARVRSDQEGWTFAFEKPPPGTAFRMRGIVDFKWTRRRRRVVKRRRAVTRAGLSGVDAGDPPGTSLASCLIA
jgi:hypothetical protein